MAGALLSRGILVTTFFRSISDASMKKTSVANISRAPCSTCAKQLEFYAYRFFENLLYPPNIILGNIVWIFCTFLRTTRIFLVLHFL